MKLVIVAILAMIGTTVYLLWRDQNNLPIPIPFRTASSSASQAPNPPAPKPPPPKAKPIKKEAAPIDRQAQAVPQEPRPSGPEKSDSAPRAATPAPVIHWPFPNVDQVALGAGEDAVTDHYGSPSAWAVTSRDGHIVETLVYTQERGVSATVIRVVDGRVSAAYSKAEPSAPRGSLVRTFDLQD